MKKTYNALLELKRSLIEDFGDKDGIHLRVSVTPEVFDRLIIDQHKTWDSFLEKGRVVHNSSIRPSDAFWFEFCWIRIVPQREWEK